MKTTLIALAAAIAFSAVPAHAQENLPQVKVSGQYSMAPTEFGDYLSTYRLSNGQMVQMSSSNNRYYAQVDKGQRVRLLPVSPTEFVTESGVRVEFRDHGEEIAITDFDKLPKARAVPNTIMVARR